MTRRRISWADAEVRLPDGRIVEGALHWRSSTGGAVLRVSPTEVHTLTEAFEAVDLDDTGHWRSLTGAEGTWEVRWVDNSACQSCTGRSRLT